MAARRAHRPKRARGTEPSGSEDLALDREAVRYWRLQRGWTQEALARQRVTLDEQPQTLSYSQIRRIESTGRCGPTSARILAALLDVSLSQLSPRDGRHLPCGLPREPSTDFVGREPEIKSVLAALESRGSVRIAASIEGLPGIGKTELALQICGLCERERRFRIFWFEAQQPDLTGHWADVVAPHLGVAAETPEERASQAIRRVESLAEPVLLVLDNLEEWSASRPWPRPRGRHIHWLVTTRRADLGGRAFQHIDVPVLEPAAAERLLLQIAGPQLAQRPGFRALLDALGGYTIAVELAATFLRRFPDVEPEEYAAELERGQAAELEDEVGARSAYGQTLERALELLWERLPAKLRRHWQLAAQFAQAPASPALSDACGLDRRARAELRDHHLIDPHPTRGWSMHRLVRAFGRAAGTAEERREAALRLFRGCVERASGIDLRAGFAIYAPDPDHYDLALELGATAADPGAMALLQAKVGTARASQGDLASSRSVLEAALETGKQLPPAERSVCMAQAVLGDVLMREGKLAASHALLEEALAIALPILGADEERVRDLQNNLAATLSAMGELEQAKAIEEEILASCVRQFGPAHPEVSWISNNLAVTLRGLGDLRRARTLCEQALEIRLSCYGEDHFEVGITRSNLAAVLQRLGELSRAKQLAEQALETAIATGGEGHPSVALRRSRLASILQDLGELPRAKLLYEQVLEQDLARYGEGHPEVARSRSNLALILRLLGQPAQAKEPTSATSARE